MSAVRPFRISIDQSVQQDLSDRLRDSRFPNVASNEDWSRGTSQAYLRELVRSWRDDFDWPAVEADYNRLAQFQATVGEHDVHFIHVRSSRDDAQPLLLVHGWPDSPFRFRKVIAALTEPEQPDVPAFHVVAPSLPGFGFTQGPASSSAAAAGTFATLMTDILGYRRFFGAGGDLGTRVLMAVGRSRPELLHGLHLTDVGFPSGREPDLSPAEQEFAAYIGQWWFTQGAYAMVQSTKPHSVGHALNDSPAGLASWLLSFIDTGAEDHDVAAAFGGRDHLLANLCLYWFTGTAASAAEVYQLDAESYGAAAERVAVPTGVAAFPRDAAPPREWGERQVNLVHYTAATSGGHFAPLEVPDAYVADVRAFAASQQ